MSKGFSSAQLPALVLGGIESAFDEWLEMSGEWLQSAPEYLLTVNVAQALKAAIPVAQRTLLMEPHVASTLADAGGIQRGPKAAKLRSGGRYDIVLGHGNGLPRAVIELKNPLWARGLAARHDLDRICHSLLQGKAKTQLYTGLFAFYTSSAPPVTKDTTAKERLERKWVTEWQRTLQSWAWAEANQSRYEKHLKVAVTANIHERDVGKSKHAWAAVCVQITRKPR
ncbi:type I restriction enzyme HsdR N-terminal domain-containing protein [Niveibacterium sp. 24ML]|uniref:type I restriction enzyme HsdR N-terminal domain-containing protein n=1 Tax=Niveibacterium sp. 24ML TaxID=2985512 RepID=UPI00226D80BE|nr:type I restriction enzyme HsdR N-terminal domain-containing protein [Niveibacterium sp. 24ML]MCX9154615.1 type I restriction enzyme HsdR N-terminal domain-containing protein [Niveibacterium sp. 24ML]